MFRVGLYKKYGTDLQNSKTDFTMLLGKILIIGIINHEKKN